MTGSQPSMSSQQLVLRLLLDAQDELLRVIDHISAPGRGGAWGRLNAPGWIVAHVASSLDNWINVLVGGSSRDEQLSDWSDRQQAATLEHPLALPLDEAREAFRHIAARAARTIDGYDTAALDRPIDTPRGRVTAAYLVARALGHLFAHAGELSVIATLAGTGNADLPDALVRCSAGDVDEPGTEDAPLVARLVLDARAEVVRVAEALPQPARHGAIERLPSGTQTIARLTQHEDTVWNAAAQGRRREASIAASVDGGLTFDDALAAFQRATEASADYLEALRGEDLARLVEIPDTRSTVGAELAVSVALLFAEAGALMALGSLFGAPDLALPGPLAHVAGGVGTRR